MLDVRDINSLICGGVMGLVAKIMIWFGFSHSEIKILQYDILIQAIHVIGAVSATCIGAILVFFINRKLRLYFEKIDRDIKDIENNG